VRVIPPLAYSERPGFDSVEQLVTQLEAAARDALGGPPDVWHFHNHSVGKNAAVPLAVSHLADLGRRVLLHIHDFPEDGRPQNYALLRDQLGRGDAGRLGRILYPQAGHVHYALLNRRDLGFMSGAGVPPERLHLLPNPASLKLAQAPAPTELPPRTGRCFLYPSRAIRRKNLGEFLLWSAAAERGDQFASTRAPRNPKARPVYKRWVRFAGQLDLPVRFDVAAKSRLSFPELLGSAYALATTSVAEGFGLSFLEPWLVDRPLVGRNLPEITGDFASAGLDLSGLYDRLDVPLGWVGAAPLRERVRSVLKEVLSAYGRPPRPDAADRAFDSMVARERVDFGRLDEPFQEHVIRTVHASPEARGELRPVALGPHCEPGDVIARNRRTVLREFSIERYGTRLGAIYDALMESERGPRDGLDASRLLDRFLAPERFSLLRTS